MKELAEKYDLQEVNVIDAQGIITASSVEELVGFDMKKSQNTAEFMVLLNSEKEFVQDLRANEYNEASGLWKFAGITLPGKQFLQVGCLAERFQDDIDEEVAGAAKNRHIGKKGSIIICNVDGIIVSDEGDREGQNIFEQNYPVYDVEEGERFETEMYGDWFYCMYGKSEGYYIVSVLPISEGLFTRDVAIYLLLFMELLVFAVLFAHIAYLLKRIVVDNIHKINYFLGEITGGNLDTVVDVCTNEEFTSLSNDINSTVATLKKYIEEAEARIDKELEFSRKIQCASLPSVFPPYPHRKDFDIYASMDTAKEVGGDFYDFYMLGEDKLVFLIADVSGKGIPAAMFMMTAKTLIKGLVESGKEVDEVFALANTKLCENNDADMFVTAWMGILDLQTGVVRYANAGHNPPLIRRKNGQFDYFRERGNFVLAGMEGMEYEAFTLQLEPGDEIYLYTDGVTEAKEENGEFFGEERLLASLNEKAGLSVEEICKKVKTDLDTFAGRAEQFDDITMLCVRLNEKTNGISNQGTPTLERLKELLDSLTHFMEKNNIPQAEMKKILIAADEIYSNIVFHSGANYAKVTCSSTKDEVVVRFQDNGIPYNPIEKEAPDISLSVEERKIGGLGIYMVRKMMDAVAYSYQDGQNVLTIKVSFSK